MQKKSNQKTESTFRLLQKPWQRDIDPVKYVNHLKNEIVVCDDV